MFAGVPSSRVSQWLLLVLHRSVLPVSVGIGSSVLRPRLTSAPPGSAFTDPFQGFGQALLAGATLGLDQAMQISPDKSVMLRCTSASFTCAVDWGRLRTDGRACLTEPALYDVSVRRLAALTWMHPGGDMQTRRLPIHPQASSPRSVTLPQLPSSSTSLSSVVIWYTDP